MGDDAMKNQDVTSRPTDTGSKDVREAFRVTGLPVGEHGDDGLFYQVGGKYQRPDGKDYKPAGTVTRITVTADLPGLYCNLERVRVFDGETLICEAPLHNVESVEYLAPGQSS
jgi:hypothetical protein